MSAITLHLEPETERKLRDRAEKNGTTVESLLQRMAEESTRQPAPIRSRCKPRFITEPHLTDEEFQQVLDDIAKGPRGTPLPLDFTREDIYIDHD